MAGDVAEEMLGRRGKGRGEREKDWFSPTKIGF
jgi:hypothetical protein